MLISNTVSSSILKSAKRFEPKFFLIDKLFESYKSSDKFNVIKLGDPDLLKCISDGEHAGQKFVDKGIMFIKNSSIKNFQISRYDGFYIEESKHKKQVKSALKKGDVLLTTIGYLGASAVVPEDLGEANINQNLVRMEINQQLINPYYLSAYLNSKLTKNQINNMFAGNIQPILTHKKIKDLYIIYPKDKTKSDKIVENLKKAEECEAESIKLIEEALNLFNTKVKIDSNSINKRSVFSIKSTQLRNIDNLWSCKYFRFNMSDEIKNLNNEFKTIYLNDDVIELTSGKEAGSSNYISYMDKNIDDVPFIRTSDLFNYDIDMYPDNYVPLEIKEKYKLDVKKGDILFTKDGKIGEVAMMADNYNILMCAGITRIRVKDDYKDIISNEYLFTAMLSNLFKDQVKQRIVYSSTIPHLRPERLKTIKLPILDKESMDDISSLIKKAFELKQIKNQVIEETTLEMEDILNDL